MKQNPMLRLAKEKQVKSMIKHLSDLAGGDDEAWLKEYTEDLIKNKSIDDVIACIGDVTEWYGRYGKHASFFRG